MSNKNRLYCNNLMLNCFLFMCICFLTYSCSGDDGNTSSDETDNIQFNNLQQNHSDSPVIIQGDNDNLDYKDLF